MGLDKFLKDDKKEELILTKKDYKSKVNHIVKNTFEKDDLNLLQIEKENTTNKKVPMSVYFEKEDLDLLKAIAFEKNTTVNKVLMSIIKEPLKTTKINLPHDFNINEKSKEYEVNSKKRKVEKKVETRGRKKKIK
ncbi:hypothetical protein GNF68_12310 [Clostridium perfringens]|uniref:Uncharacterized protein n=1 Tax=Clostridium perfringens TaxID=1502 RepID=A0AAW9I604_CLOPF|nr:hypothetical protein [Clostridium perfringens]MDZ4909836.1 hypothetical protein [Clostridium perfringens]